MGKSLGKKYTNKMERIAFLKDNCDACENKGCMKPYTPECRQDGIVDLGIWHNLKPSQLMIPLDTHVARIGHEMGLISRNSNDWAAVEELTAQLRELDENDPCKYDFALFGLGESQKRMKP